MINETMFEEIFLRLETIILDLEEANFDSRIGFVYEEELQDLRRKYAEAVQIETSFVKELQQRSRGVTPQNGMN